MTNLHQTLEVIGAAQALFASGLLVALGRRHGSATAWLAAFIGLYGLTFVADNLFVQTLYVRIPILVPLFFGFFLALGPCLYGYTAALSDPTGRAAGFDWRKHIVVVLLGIILISAWVGLPTSEREAAIDGNLDAQTGQVFVLGILTVCALIYAYIVLAAYLVASTRALTAHNRKIRDLFSNLEDKKLVWLRNLIIAMATIWLADLLTEVFDQTGRFTQAGEVIFTLAELLLLYAFSFFGIRQPNVFGLPPASTEIAGDGDGKVVQIRETPEDSSKTKSLTEENSSPRYEKSALTDGRMQTIADKLERAMETDRIYEEPTLTLAALSRHVGVQQTYVSQTLNQKLGRKFYDYIAIHRVEAAKTLLSDKDNQQSVLDIALAVGFNSKSTFNAAFKRFTGVTPTAFREEASQAA